MLLVVSAWVIHKCCVVLQLSVLLSESTPHFTRFHHTTTLFSLALYLSTMAKQNTNIGLDRRVTYRRHHSFRTLNNRLIKVRTPGKRLSVQLIKKRRPGVFTPGYLGHKKIQGIQNIRNKTTGNTYKNARTVSRAYGGVLNHSLLRERVIRAFLVEEQRIVKKLLSVKGTKKAGKR
mmetsp:Transcript_3925/g.14861  ORF Transcript_3925/g.14861 Transcript_3925/m.14861 type:complete len:176 (-) Transcript_3925:1179-1706(-)